MEVDKIGYYAGGEEHDFLENQAMNEKIKLLTEFLIKTGITFKLEDFGDASGKFINLGKGVTCNFHQAGGTYFEYDEELKEEDE